MNMYMFARNYKYEFEFAGSDATAFPMDLID